MKKLLLIILLVYFSVFQVYSQDDSLNIYNSNLSKGYYSTYFNQFGIRALYDISLRFFFPIKSIGFLSFINFGFGLGIDILKDILSPGIYFDIGIGTDWFFNPIRTNDTNIYIYTGQLAFSDGLRLYNVIRINHFKIIPFIGYNFMFFSCLCQI